jgi:cytidine deaminase
MLAAQKAIFMRTIEALLAAAMTARNNAYVPYSGFAVGAAIRTPTGAIFSGANVENAAYPIGTCAEAGAIAAMVAGGERCIAEILVVGDSEALVTPCGACRQRIFEFANADVKIHVAGLNGIRGSYTIDQLLPHAFGPSLGLTRKF